MQDLFTIREYLSDFNKSEESQRKILRAINDAFFMNNRLYKSDFNEELFTKQSGVTCLTTHSTVFGSKQQIVIGSTKHMI
jgi:hypothetical protein